MGFYEVNFDGMPGMTHLFSGLSDGNIASSSNKGKLSYPKKAALQSLEKMKFVYELGIKQAFIPPQEKPIFELIEKNKKAAFASSNMWTANAATVSPSPDTSDGKLHLTIANLTANYHRSLEASFTEKYFMQVFNNKDLFCVHAPLHHSLQDEGAANHNRFCTEYGKLGLELFVCNFDLESTMVEPMNYPARHCKEASLQHINQHRLDPGYVFIAQQNPQVVDAGVFHNDVISTANKDHFLFHEHAFQRQNILIDNLSHRFKEVCAADMKLICASDDDFSVEDAVTSYFFNSQLLSVKDGMLLLAPNESKENIRVKAFIDKIISSQDNAINQVEYIDLTQSMSNGGGPACLRLRVVMSEEELAATKQTVFFDNKLYDNLSAWINKFYPDELNLESAMDKDFHKEIKEAYKNLASLLELEL